MPPARIAFWLATAAGLGLLAQSILAEPLPLWGVVVALVVYATLCTVGVVFPGLRMYGDVVTHGPSGSPRVALTFDDGPHPHTTPRVLELLAEHGCRATFFMIGRKAELYPEVVQEVVRHGHELGLHGYDHDRLSALHSPRRIERDVRRVQDVLEVITGKRPALFRPPVGHVSPRTVAAAKRAEVRLIAWSVRALDGLPTARPSRVVGRVTRGLRDGAIIMLHDAAELDAHEPATLQALPQILRAIEERGLTPVTVSELLEGTAASAPSRSAD